MAANGAHVPCAELTLVLSFHHMSVRVIQYFTPVVGVAGDKHALLIHSILRENQFFADTILHLFTEGLKKKESAIHWLPLMFL